MIIGEKIYRLRKNAQMSQEELANQLNVSRQSISKWESSVSIPEVSKIIEMSKIFDVSCDYLLIDDNEEVGMAFDAPNSDKSKVVSLELCHDILKNQAANARYIAKAVILFILAPAVLIGFYGFAEYGLIAENVAQIFGLSIMFIMIAIGVGALVFRSNKFEKYQFIEGNDFDLGYGVEGFLKEHLQRVKGINAPRIAVAIVLFIISPLPLMIGGALFEDGAIVMWLVSLLLLIVAIGVYIIIPSVSDSDTIKKLLKIDDYSYEKKRSNAKLERFAGFYWPIVVLIYLAWSFISGDWGITWVVWPVAGILFGALSNLFKSE